MLAFLLNYDADPDNTSLGLWKNDNGNWQYEYTILASVPKSGTLELKKRNETISICCNGIEVPKRFNLQLFEGKAGVRCLGSQFKNFRVDALY